MKWTLSILVLVFAVPASVFGVTLKPIGEPPSALLPIDTSAPPIPCDQILTQLMKFKDMNRQHEDSVIAFLGQAIEKISGWYDVLAPLEGGRNSIDAGTFEPIRNGAEKMSMIVDYSYDNTALLASELDRIIVSLRECPPALSPILNKR
ncbi:MAG: hypothetical protein HC883_05320 [Bdellovibrionaceae bacterium]|nr:hypothetical protein [Pseudobdellovibrionaceae bacterium]